MIHLKHLSLESLITVAEKSVTYIIGRKLYMNKNINWCIVFFHTIGILFG